jgi:hypothetical protein
MRAKEPSAHDSSPTGPSGERPLLMVDIDGVISLFGFPAHALAGPRSARGTATLGLDGALNGALQTIDGIPHFLSRAAAAHLLRLAEDFDLVWCSGWEEKAEEYLPRLLGLPAGLPFLRFERMTGSPPARAGRSIVGHWKLDAIDAYAGTRALAWIDDALNDACHAWADARPAPTLLVQTDPAVGLTAGEAETLVAWATC